MQCPMPSAYRIRQRVEVLFGAPIGGRVGGERTRHRLGRHRRPAGEEGARRPQRGVAL